MAALIWFAFFLVVIVIVWMDLRAHHREAAQVSFHDALSWTLVWVLLAFVFNIIIYFLYEENWLGWSELRRHDFSGQDATLSFLTSYLIQKSLSINNLFVMAMILAHFRIPANLQYRLLFWGVLGAVALRGLMIWTGTALIWNVRWVAYLFGGFLILSAVRMLFIRYNTIRPGRNPLVRLARSWWDSTDRFTGDRFFVLSQGHWEMTPLVPALLLIASSDLAVAVDAIPAAFAITRDPFLAMASSVFAVLGLKSLYFTLAGLMDRLRPVQVSLVFLLVYVGVKMLLSLHVAIPNSISLAVVTGVLVIGVVVAWRSPPQPERRAVPLLVDFSDLALVTYRQARRIAILVVGTTVVLVGVAMLVLPGPAFVVIPLGLAILSIEFAWARRWLKHMRDMAVAAQRRVTGRDGESASGDHSEREASPRDADD